MKIYLMGSMRNPAVPEVATHLRSLGHDVFDDWHAPGPECDDFWQRYEQARGRTYKEALDAPHAWNVFRFDKLNLDKSDVGVLVLPAGKSAHIELGYLIGTGKRAFVLFDKEPERWDVMYRFATGVVMSVNELAVKL